MLLGMDTQPALVWVAGALVVIFAFQVWRSTRQDMSGSAVSEAWLAERKRVKENEE